MSEYDLTTKKGMVAWLATLPPEIDKRDAAVVIASRAAARVLPLVLGSWAEISRDNWRHLQLAVCRAIFSSAVAALVPTAELRAAASAASRAASFSAASRAASRAASAASDAALLGREGLAASLTARLWSMDSTPDSLLDAWTDCHTAMEADPADWSFWIDWYRGWLEGRLPPRALAEEIVTSKDIDWDDPIAANAKIVEIWKRHQKRNPLPLSDEVTFEALANLDGMALRAALADFRYDTFSRLLEMVPFSEEAPSLDEEAIRSRLANLLSELADELAEFVEDSCAPQRNWRLPWDDERELTRYVAEARLSLDDIRPGRLRSKGEVIVALRLDPEIEENLGVKLHKRLQRVADLHRQIMQDYFAQTIARTQNLAQVPLNSSVSLDDALGTLEAALATIEEGAKAGLVDVRGADIAALNDELDYLSRELRAIRAIDDPEQRESRISDMRAGIKRLGLTLQHAYKASRDVLDLPHKATGIASSLKNLLPEDTWKAFVELLKLFSNSGGS